MNRGFRTLMGRIRGRFPSAPAEVIQKKARICNKVLQSQMKSGFGHAGRPGGPGGYRSFEQYCTSIFDSNPEEPPKEAAREENKGKLFNTVVEKAARDASRDKITQAIIACGISVDGDGVADRAKDLEQFCLDWALSVADYHDLVQYLVENADTTYMNKGIPIAIDDLKIGQESNIPSDEKREVDD